MPWKQEKGKGNRNPILWSPTHNTVIHFGSSVVQNGKVSGTFYVTHQQYQKLHLNNTLTKSATKQTRGRGFHEVSAETLIEVTSTLLQIALRLPTGVVNKVG